MSDPDLLSQSLPSTNSAKFQFNLYGGLRDDPRTGSLHDPHGFCPSSWHSGNDRHSPVFPTLFQPETQLNTHSHNPIPPFHTFHPYHYDQDQELANGEAGSYNSRIVHPHPNHTQQHLQHHYNHHGYHQNIPHRRRQSCALDASGNSGQFRNCSVPYGDQRDVNYELNPMLCSNRLHHQCHRQPPQQQQQMMNTSSSSSSLHHHHHPSSHPTQMFFSNNNYFITYNIDSSSSADNYETASTCPPQQYSKRDAALHSPEGATANTFYGSHSPDGAIVNTYNGVQSPGDTSANSFRGVLQFAGGHQRSSSTGNGQDVYVREPALVQFAEKKAAVIVDWPLVRSIGSSCQYSSI